jgi:hypothetical protein
MGNFFGVDVVAAGKVLPRRCRIMIPDPEVPCTPCVEQQKKKKVVWRGRVVHLVGFCRCVPKAQGLGSFHAAFKV